MRPICGKLFLQALTAGERYLLELGPDGAHVRHQTRARLLGPVASRERVWLVDGVALLSLPEGVGEYEPFEAAEPGVERLRGGRRLRYAGRRDRARPPTRVSSSP